MTASFIVRLVDAQGAVLAWAEVLAQARPQGRPRSTPFEAVGGKTPFVIERDGTATHLIVHWHDLDLVRQTPLMEGAVPVQAGQVMTFHWIEPVWMVGGSQAHVATLQAVRTRLKLRDYDFESPESVVDEMITAGMQDIPLAPVTVRAKVAIGVPAGGLGVVSP